MDNLIKNHQIKEVNEYQNNVSDKVLVSVCVPTYQHVNYIKKCLDGILMQKTGFEFEILLGEDDSSDGTREICKQYAKKYPDEIRLFLNDRKNVIYIDGQPTGRWNFVNLLKNAKGKYIALCEGDDYWTDPYKLQKQVDFLEANPSFSMCFHNTIFFYDDNISIPFVQHSDNLKNILTIEDLIRGNAPATCSVMFRNGLFHELPVWYYEAKMGDWPLHILNAQYGDSGYIPDVMGARRYHSGGVHAKYRKDKLLFKEMYVETQALLEKVTNYRYQHITGPIIAHHYLLLIEGYLDRGNRVKSIKFFFRKYAPICIRNKLASRKRLFKMFLILYVPVLYKLARASKNRIRPIVSS